MGDSRESGGAAEEDPPPRSQNETWERVETAVPVTVEVPIALEVRESYADAVGDRRWVARHVGVPPVEVRARTREGALRGLARHVARAFATALAEAVKGS